MKKFAIGEECKSYEVFIVEAETFEDAVRKINKEYDEYIGESSDIRNYIDITDVVIENIGYEVFDDLHDTIDNYDELEEEKKRDIFHTLDWGNLVKGVFYEKNERVNL